MNEEGITMNVIINVYKAKKPLVTVLTVYNLTHYPMYSHNEQIEKEFVKTIMPFEKPTQSEII